MAGVNPIFVDQGASWYQMITLEAPRGTPMPGLDLWSPRMQVRPLQEWNAKVSTPLLLTLTLGDGIDMDVPSASLGLTITDDQTGAFVVPYNGPVYATKCRKTVPQIGHYDIILEFIEDPTITIRILQGPFCVSPRVTLP